MSEMTEMTEMSFADLFEESLQTIDMQSGSIISGLVVDIDSEWVTVHAGLKSEGVNVPPKQNQVAAGVNQAVNQPAAAPPAALALPVVQYQPFPQLQKQHQLHVRT